MKSLRLLLALALAGFLTTGIVRAAGEKARTGEKTCGCARDKGGKVGGKDKDCCCTGKKCEKDAAKSGAKPAGKK